jgi:hypothetical protein
LAGNRQAVVGEAMNGREYAYWNLLGEHANFLQIRKLESRMVCQPARPACGIVPKASCRNKSLAMLNDPTQGKLER